ncbi:Acyl-[acyl-carrier-protein]--UDP-N-acetylglucosamine O-acyltransferase [Sporomusa ovata DSM 2662]|uniref:Acyl-[acyl-carrier-protein]--UDP-N-acetylglucosamine O-acyltransferase n=1 Tax=Sporomusa ovata TaxID=2378 RepID=A0A0U1KYR0_9FIRM|nr:acyl-[acyl-carrier-protein]--UDP-N-acetylglucosamine O-acyltransferase [Sporomusa ovata DSM 2662]CQR72552.1 Acyl-[acyl-carrier-protein]--UDP-N-acetylglucosamine O-acyltransferase [Sporomusa ovata]
MLEKVVLSRPKIHETAIVHPAARISDGVEIGPYAVIGENVFIGNGTRIGSHVVIEDWTSIGRDCEIFHSASIGAIPQDLKFCGEKSYVFIGDRTQIREFVTIHRAVGEEEETRIGSDCLLQTYTHVAHNCKIGNHVILSGGATLAGHVVIEDYATIGGLVGIHQFVRIGCYAMVGGASKVNQDVPPFFTVDGHPARVIGTNDVGLARRAQKILCK